MKNINTIWIQGINATCPLLFNHCKFYSQRVDKKTCTISTPTFFKGRTFLYASFFLMAVMFSANLVKAQVTFTVTGSYNTQVYPGAHNPANTGTYTCSPTFPIPNSGSVISGIMYELSYVGITTNQANNWDKYVYTASSNIVSYTFPFTSMANNAGTNPLMVKIYDSNNVLINASNYTLETLNPCPNTYTFGNYSTTEKYVYKNLTTSAIGQGFATLFKISSTVPFKKIEFRHGYPMISNPNTAGGLIWLYASNYSTGAICSAGTTAPSVTATTATNTCPTTTVNLASLAVSSTTPIGASLIWSTHSTPTAAGDTLTTAQASAVNTAGKYYALYYDATNACYSPADSVDVTITACAINLANTCPTATVNLMTAISATNLPSGATVTWHTGAPATTANKITDPTAVSTSGNYYMAYFDGTNNCYSNTSQSVTVTITPCVTPLSASNPAAQTATTGQAKTGNAATELAPTGGTAPYIYSNGAGDVACVAPSGATALPAGSNLTVNSSTGAYTYTAPSTAGTYYFCIKICDSATPTASCVVKTYTLTVSAAPCTVNGITPTFIKN